MAQWMGQFSGNTHGTKVQSLEKSLRVAVAALLDSSETDKHRKTEAAYRLAQKLHAARLKLLRASASRLSESREFGKAEREIPALLERIKNMESAGVKLVLAEFGVERLSGNQ